MRLYLDEDLLAALELNVDTAASEFGKRLAASYYRDGRLSFGKAANLAGLDAWGFWDYLVESGIPVVSYDERDLARDLEVFAGARRSG